MSNTGGRVDAQETVGCAGDCLNHCYSDRSARSVREPRTRAIKALTDGRRS
jgi:hypothetical protein